MPYLYIDTKDVCPEGWSEYKGKCFIAKCEEPITFQEAKGLCKGISAHLALPTDAEMDNWIYSLHNLHSWIDLSDDTTEGQWVDSNGDTASYHNWKSSIGSPNGKTSQNCAYQHSDGLTWDDAACDHKMKCAVCQGISKY